MTRSGLASSRINLFSREALEDPYPRYKELRDTGPAVWLSRHGFAAISRFQDVRAALQNAGVFSSASGVAMNALANRAQQGTMLASDNPRHNALRAIVSRPLTPAAVRGLSNVIQSESDALVDRLVARQSFDAVRDLAWYLPLTVVSRLVGVPEDARARMPAWASAVFDASGPLNWRTLRSIPRMRAFLRYIMNPDLPGRLRPDGWGAMIFQAAERGEIDAAECQALLADYLAPSLDTTASATASLVWLLSQNPEQWDAIRADPTRIPNAVLEAVRLESPIPAFTRMVTQDIDVGGVAVRRGTRVYLSYASANRDERKWAQPDRFDVHRRSIDQLGFGHGVHSCMGMHLAQLEIRSLLQSLVSRVRRFNAGQPRRQLNNALRGFAYLPVCVEAA